MPLNLKGKLKIFRSGVLKPYPSTNLYFRSLGALESNKFYSATGVDKRQIQPGRCYLADGTNDHVTYGDIAALSFERTDVLELEVSVKFTSVGSMSSFSKMNNSGTFRGWDIAFNAGKLIFYLISTFSSSVIGVQTVAAFNDGNAHSVKINYDGTSVASGVVVTIDDSVQSTTTLYDNLTTTIDNASVACIGARNSAATFFNGRVWGAKATKAGVLVFQAKCDEDDGTTSYDSSGAGNNGTITNATLSTFHSTQDTYSFQNNLGYNLVSGVYIPRDESDTTNDVLGNPLLNVGVVKPYALIESSNCGNHDGTNDYVATTVASNFATDYVLFCEFNPDVVTGTNVGKYRLFQTSLGGSTRFTLTVDDSKIVMGYNTGSFILTTGVAVSAGDNVKACIRKSGTTLQLYVDGVKIDDVTATLLDTDSTVINIGTSNTTPARWFDGRIWNTQFYSAALTEAQCEQLTTDGVAIESSQTLIAPFSEGAGTAIYDVSGNNNHCTATNITESTFWGTPQDTHHYNILNGFEHYDDDATGLVIIRVPYESDGTQITPTISGYTKNSNNPTVVGHNNAESTFDFRNVALGDVVSPKTAHLANSTNFTAFTFDVDTGWDTYDYAFYRQESSLINDRFLLYSEALTGAALAKADRYTGN